MSSSGPFTEAREGLLIVGHGTRDQAGTRQFFQLVELVAGWSTGMLVEPCLLELQSPTIADGWQTLVRRGAEHIHVSPLLLFSAGHAKQDIPDAIRDCAAKTPHIFYDFSRPLSRHPAVLELATARIVTAIKRLGRTNTAVLAVGRGSHDPCARTDMFFLSEIVAKVLRHQATSLGIAPPVRFETSFYAMAQPRLPEILTAIAQETTVDGIVVYPHLLFEGRLNQAIHDQVAEVATRFPEKQFEVAQYLGPESQIATAITDRALMLM